VAKASPTKIVEQMVKLERLLARTGGVIRSEIRKRLDLSPNELSDLISALRTAGAVIDGTSGRDTRLHLLKPAFRKTPVHSSASTEEETTDAKRNGMVKAAFPSLAGCRNRLWRIRKASDRRGRRSPHSFESLRCVTNDPVIMLTRSDEWQWNQD